MKRRKFILFAVGLLAFCILGWIFFFPHEPSYQGKLVTDWIRQYGTNRWQNHDRKLEMEAQTALRQCGARAIPYYVTMISAHPYALKTNLLERLPQVWLTRLHLSNSMEYIATLETRRNLGSYGLIALDAEAKPAVPRLIALLDDKLPEVRHAAIFALANLGPAAHDALPALIQCLQDKDIIIRLDAVAAIGNLHEDPERMIPILFRFLDQNRKNEILSDQTIEAISDYKTDPAAAIRAVQPYLQDDDPFLRETARKILVKFDSRKDLTLGLR